MANGLVSEGAAPGGELFVVSTPIGNMGDFSFRGVETLRRADVVLAEDTRHSRPLLVRHEITTPLLAYHEHNERAALPAVLRRLRAGERVALISDAGTPLLSDPGARLVEAAVQEGIRVTPVPGASALLAALVVAGLGMERFTFYGFLARKGRERGETLSDIAGLTHAAVIFEAPSRVCATLSALLSAGAAAERPAAVARELTKQFEEVKRGTLEELRTYYKNAPPKGEVVIVIGGAAPAPLDEDAMRRRASVLHEERRTVREIGLALAREFGAPRNLAYRLARDRQG